MDKFNVGGVRESLFVTTDIRQKRPLPGGSIQDRMLRSLRISNQIASNKQFAFEGRMPNSGSRKSPVGCLTIETTGRSRAIHRVRTTVATIRRETAEKRGFPFGLVGLILQAGRKAVSDCSRRSFKPVFRLTTTDAKMPQIR